MAWVFLSYICSCLSFFFFFSSRRRHTRSDRDWSSDVCSSDLLARNVAEADRCADSAGIAMKQVLPQRVSQNRNVVMALDTILRYKRPALQRDRKSVV